MTTYLVISADCHAGLPNREYREWLDPEYRERFDEALEARARMAELAQQGFLNKEFSDEWHAEHEEGLRGSWDASRRDAELDADGVAGEVIFPDADSVSSGASAPFGAGLGATGDTPAELLFAGARAHNRWLAELCNQSPARRAGVAIVPIMVDVDAAVAEIRRAHASGLRGGILIPAMWQPF
ncbi:MAG: amidohydrolase family protein, partial [Acidimicrobiales bacterium]|nr:amidohydrolase family protein [Acidimicrobiales bacterium]